MRLSKLLIGLGIVLGASPAAALPEDGFSANRFEPAARGASGFQLDTLDMRGKLRIAAGTTLDYAHRPLVLYTADGDPDYSVVRNRLDLHMGASVVAFDRFRADVTMPFALVNDGVAGTKGNGSYREPYRNPAQGDLRLGVDARLFGKHHGPLTVAVGARLWLPTGDPYSYTGDEALRFAPQALAAGRFQFLTYAARAHYMYRAHKVPFGNGSVGNDVGVGLGASALLLEEKLQVGPELTWATRASDLSFKKETTPIELLLGAHYMYRERFRFGAGVSFGLTDAIGSPGVRAVGTFDYVFEALR